MTDQSTHQTPTHRQGRALGRVGAQEASDELAAPLAHVVREGAHAPAQDVGDRVSQVVGVGGVL
jgi:hypothetical protein